MPSTNRGARDTSPNWESLLRHVENAKLANDPQIQQLLQLGIASDNNRLEQRIQKLVQAKIAQQQAQPFEQYDQPLGLNRLRLGSSSTGAMVALDTDDLTKHLLTVGQSGSGKTTLFYNLMWQLEVPFWSFDLKQDYRHLAQEDSELLVLPWSEFRFNPLKPPPGVPPRRWAQVFSEIFGHATALLSGSKNYLLKQLVTLYQLYDLFDKVSEPYPSLHELEMLIDTDKINYVRKASNYRDTLLNRIEAMNLTAGTVFDCSQGYPIEELLKRNIVFEFDGLSRDVQNFLMEVLFAYVYEYRLATGQRDEGLNHVFFLDEGKRVFSVYKERQDAAGIPEIDQLTAKMREFGEGLVVGDQEVSKLTDSIKANTYTKVLLPTGDRKQFNAIRGSMNLTERQAEQAQKLGTGEAVIQVGNSDPVPVKLDDYELEKTVSENELRGLQSENWYDLSYEPRETTLQFETHVASGREDDLDEPDIIDDPTEIIISNDANRMLEDIVQNPFKPLTDRYDQFSSTYKGNKAKDELVENGVIIERHVKTGSGKRKLLELTENGRDYVEDSVDLDTEQEGRGGIIHRYWQHRIKRLLQDAGWSSAGIEFYDADVYLNLGSSELVIEVAMGNNQREIDHVKQHLETGFDVIWVVSRNEEVRDGLKRRLEENDLLDDRISFRLFRQFNDAENLPW